MNIIPTSHSHIESHTITSCMHEHYSVQKGGANFKTEMQQTIRERPQTLEEALNELAAINRESDSKHKILGIGNTLGNVISDVTGEGEETVVMLMPENMAASKNGDNNLTVSPEMLNALVMPRKNSIYSQQENEIKLNTISEFDTNTASKEQLQKRKRKFVQLRIKNVKKRIKKWMHSLPEKISDNENKLDSNQRKMKPLTQEYILDSYDKNGQFYQIEKNGIINDNLNKKA